MYGRFVDLTLLFGSLTGLAITGWWTVYAGPNNAASLQEQLQKQAEMALREGGHEWASVTMNGQLAHLTGQTPNFEGLEAATASLGGARPLWGAVTKITTDVTSAPPVAPYVFNAEKDEESGRVLLRGYVPDSLARAEILAKAEDIAPGRVDNQLQIGSGEPLGAWKDLVLAGLTQLGGLKGGALALEDSVLSLSGRAASVDFETDALAVFNAFGRSFETRLDIAGPALWTARHSGDVLTLSGRLGDQAQKDAMLALARAHFNGVVQDDMRLEPGLEDDWLETANSLLPGFADFQSGSMSFAPDAGGFSVRGYARGSVQTYLKQDMVPWTSPVLFAVETAAVDLPELAGLDFAGDPLTACQAGFDALMAASQISFDSGKATISRQSGQTLDKIMTVAEKCATFVIEVHGHTDAAGDRETNIGLSKARAGAVKAYMVQSGFPDDALKIIGFGPDVPIADNATLSGRAANRRIEFKIVKEG